MDAEIAIRQLNELKNLGKKIRLAADGWGGGLNEMRTKGRFIYNHYYGYYNLYRGYFSYGLA
ncbi:hypothetical protein J4229_00275 [Candidatus Pacearchaeota archaeon]|nr:hypothetical protein [Candidatus Pacearchaeota archaeon]